MIIVSSGSGTVTNINTAAPLSGGPITTSGTITTAMTTNKLIGRSTAGTGEMEEITVGTGLSLSGGTLSSTGGATAAGSTNEIQFNNAGAFAADSDLRWIIANDRLVLGQENTADTNSRMVIIGKGQSTNNSFVVHNQTGTNNSLVIRDDGFIGVGTNVPGNGGGRLSVTGDIISSINTTGTLTTGVYTQSGNANERARLFLRVGNSSTGTSGSVTVQPSNALIGGRRLIIDCSGLSSSSPTTIVNNVGDNVGSSIVFLRASLEFGRFTGVGSLLLGTTTDVASSILTLQSTTKGVLLPRLTTTEVNNIATPATGLTVYNTTENTLCFYNGTSWQKVNHSNL